MLTEGDALAFMLHSILKPLLEVFYKGLDFWVAYMKKTIYQHIPGCFIQKDYAAVKFFRWNESLNLTIQLQHWQSMWW